MVMIKRRAPISAPQSTAGPSPLGQGIANIGKAIGEQIEKRKEEKQGEEAMDDYLEYSKQYNQFVVDSDKESSDNEDYDGYSDGAYNYGLESRDAFIKSRGHGPRSTYAKKFKAMTQRDIDSNTGRAITRQSEASLSIKAKKYDRDLKESMEATPFNDLAAHASGAGTYFGGTLDMSRETYGISKEKVSDYEEKIVRDEIVARIGNATLETKDEYDSFLKSDSAKQILGTDHTEIQDNFNRSMGYKESVVRKEILDKHKEILSGAQTNIAGMASSNRFLTEGDYDRITAIDPDGTMSFAQRTNAQTAKELSKIDALVEDGTLTPEEGDAMQENLSAMNDRYLAGEAIPDIQSAKKSLIEMKSERLGLNKEVADYGDDKDFKDRSKRAQDNTILLYTRLVDLRGEFVRLGMPQSDMDDLNKAISDAEVDITTYLDNAENKSFWGRFTGRNLEVGDSRRIGVVLDDAIRKIDTGIFASLPPSQRQELRQYAISQVILQQSEWIAARDSGEDAPIFDEMKTPEQAQAFVQGIINEKIREFVGEDEYDAQMQIIENATEFYNKSESLYSDLTPEAFDEVATLHGVGGEDLANLKADLKKKDEERLSAQSSGEDGVGEAEVLNESVRSLTEILEKNGLAVSSNDGEPINAEKLFDTVGRWLNDTLVINPREREITDPAYKYSPEAVNQRRAQAKFEEGFNELKNNGSSSDPITSMSPEEWEEAGMATGTNSDPLQESVVTPQKAKDLISREEGYREDVYKDTEGHLTVGIGHKLTKAELKKYKEGDVIPEAQIQKWFKEDHAKAEKSVARVVKSPEELPEDVQVVLTSMIFQMGETGVSKFENMIKALNKRPFTKEHATKAAEEMLDSEWAKQTPERAQRQAMTVRESA